MLDNLKKYHLLLASNSPRRRELLSQLRIPFNVINLGGIDESYPDSLPREEVAQYIATKKADAYTARMRDNELIITADTVVILGDRVLGKPKTCEEAVEMLLALSDKTHKVCSGVCITTRNRRTSFSTVTEVTFGEITPEEARYYVDNFMPLDKAGAYGIQGRFAAYVSGIEGDYNNVVGLPVGRLYQEVLAEGVDLLSAGRKENTQ